MKLLIAGATGLVGGQTLTLAANDSRFEAIVAPTRRALQPGPAKLANPTIDFSQLPSNLFEGVDAVACALGTTLKKAGSKERFREIDKDLVVSLATAAHRAGVRRFAYVSSVGANPKSATFYLRMKGETEAALEAIGFESLTLLRPSFLGGERDESRPLERVGLGLAKALSFAVPKRYRVVSAECVARTLLESLVAGRPGHAVIESEAIATRA